MFQQGLKPAFLETVEPLLLEDVCFVSSVFQNASIEALARVRVRGKSNITAIPHRKHGSTASDRGVHEMMLTKTDVIWDVHTLCSCVLTSVGGL